MNRQFLLTCRDTKMPLWSGLFFRSALSTPPFLFGSVNNSLGSALTSHNRSKWASPSTSTSSLTSPGSRDFYSGLFPDSCHLLWLRPLGRLWTSFSNLNFLVSRDRCFPSSLTFPSVTTNISQLSRRDPSNNNANISSARGTSREVVWFISPWKTFRCFTMLGPF